MVDPIQLNIGGANGDYFSKQGGIWVPRSLANMRSDLGYFQSSLELVEGSADTTDVVRNITIPTWATTYRFRVQAAGGGGHSGSTAAAAVAVSGGSSGSAGNYLDISGRVASLPAGSTLTVTIGGRGLGGVATTTAGGAAGSAGKDSSIRVGSTTVFNIGGGPTPSSLTVPVFNTLKFGGGFGAGGVAGTTTGGSSGVSGGAGAGSGGAGGGLNSANTPSSGGAGSIGGNVERIVAVTLPAAGVSSVSVAGGNGGNAIEDRTASGNPIPSGGGGGGGASSVAAGGKGGNGAFGGGGGGGGSARTTFNAGGGGDGGRGFAIIEFFGPSAIPISIPAIANAPDEIPSATPPTLRRDGSALRVGDKWIRQNVTADPECVWDGTRWLIPQIDAFNGAIVLENMYTAPLGESASFRYHGLIHNANYYFHRIELSIFSQSIHDATKKCVITYRSVSSTNVHTFLGGQLDSSAIVTAAGRWFTASVAINTAVSFHPVDAVSSLVWAAFTNTSGATYNTWAAINVFYQKFITS